MVAALATCLSACVIVPIPNKKLLSEETLSKVVIGTTTRDEVYATFGDQYFSDPGGSGVVYSKDRLTAFVATAWGAGTYEAVENIYLEFDDQNVLTHFEQFEFAEGKACVETGVCMIGDIRGDMKTLRSVAFVRPSNEDLNAKQFNPPTGQCSVYLYGDVSLKARYRVAGATHLVCVNEQSTTELYSPDLYLDLDLPPGTYQFAVANAFAWHYVNGLGFYRDDKDSRIVSRTLLCKADSIHFLHIEESSELKGFFVEKYMSTDLALEVVDEQVGRAAVTKRNLGSHALNVGPFPSVEGLGTEERVSRCGAVVETE